MFNLKERNHVYGPSLRCTVVCWATDPFSVEQKCTGSGFQDSNQVGFSTF